MAIQWSLVLFTALTGIAGWMLVSIAIAEVKGIQKNVAFLATVIALVLLIVGGLASVTHLSHPERMLAALNHPTSGIFVEAALVGITSVFTIIYLVLLKRDSSASARKVMIILAAVFGALLSFMAGYSYMMGARQSWNTVLLPLGYLATAIPGGIAAYMAVCLVKGDKDLDIFPKVLLIGGIIAAVGAAAYTAYVGGADVVVLGWILAVLLGGVLPAVLGGAIIKKPETALGMAGLALCCALIGSVAYRCMMWVSMSTIDNFFSPL